MSVKKVKKEVNPEISEFILAQMNAEIEDKELQSNYEKFQRTREAAKERHNKIVPVINSKIDEGNALKECIVELAIRNLCTKEAAEKSVILFNEVKELREHIAREQKIMVEEQELITKYKDYSERKFFNYWKLLKAADPKGITPWMEWFKPYKEIIF